jgi:hypothetical protein
MLQAHFSIAFKVAISGGYSKPLNGYKNFILAIYALVRDRRTTSIVSPVSSIN